MILKAMPKYGIPNEENEWMHSLPMYCDLLYPCERLKNGLEAKRFEMHPGYQKVKISNAAPGFSIFSSFSASSWPQNTLLTFQLSPDHPAPQCSFGALSSPYAIMFIHQPNDTQAFSY